MPLSPSLIASIGSRLGQRTDAPFVIFDFDNTCIIHDIGEAVFAHVCRNRLLKDMTLLGASDDPGDYHERVFHRYHEMCGQGKILDAYIFAARIFSGFTPALAASLTREAIAAEGTEIGTTDLFGRTIAHGLARNPSAMKLMDVVKSLDIPVWIISASAEVAVRTTMDHFGIEANLIGLRGVLADGRFTADLETPVSILEGKVACMKTRIDASSPPLMVVDDSTTGIPLLETADIKVVVDRGNALVEEARKRRWEMI